MIINHNLNAMNSHRNLVFNNIQQGKSSEKLSSGYRINRAADDAAGLAISEKMRAQIKSLDQGQRNVQDGISFVQTTEGAMNEVSDMLTRLKELAVQATNGTYTSTDLNAMNLEYQQLKTSISDIAANTTFNGKNLLNGGAGTVTIQYGSSTAEAIGFDFTSVDISGLTLGAVDTAGNAATELAATGVDTQIETVNTARATLGAWQNQLEHVYNNIGSTAENLQAAESRIRDTDMAKEMMNYTKFNILQQASTAMLAQANQAPQGVLQLLR